MELGLVLGSGSTCTTSLVLAPLIMTFSTRFFAPCRLMTSYRNMRVGEGVVTLDLDLEVVGFPPPSSLGMI